MEKFEKFVGENEVKRCKALQKCEATREQNFLKQREIEDLAEQLKQLRTRWENKSNNDKTNSITVFLWCFLKKRIILMSQEASFKRENGKVQNL